MTIIIHINPEAPLRRKLFENLDRFGIVGNHGSAFAHIARGTRQNHVLDCRLACLRRRDHVVKMKHSPVGVEVLENPPLRYPSTTSPKLAVLAYASIPLADGIADRGGDVTSIGHALSIARWDARRCAHALPKAQRDLLLAPWISVMGPIEGLVDHRRIP